MMLQCMMLQLCCVKCDKDGEEDEPCIHSGYYCLPHHHESNSTTLLRHMTLSTIETLLAPLTYQLKIASLVHSEHTVIREMVYIHIAEIIDSNNT